MNNQSRILPKGVSIWYFNAIGECSTDHSKVKGKQVYNCPAINETSAREKFRKRVEELFTLQNTVT